MLVLKRISFQNIGRFVEPQTIDFSSLGSLVQIDAKNLLTGGSSGSGKSTIFKALDFLLGLNDVSATVLQSRLTKDSIQVTGLFELDGVPLKIERGKKLLIDLNGEVTTGSSKLTEEKLDQIIGMPRELFRKVMHKRQGEGGFFLQMGPSEVHKFLTSCLSLEVELAKILVLDSRTTSLTEQERELTSSLEAHRIGQVATRGAICGLGEPPVLDIDPSHVETLKTRYLGAADTHALVRDSHKKEIEALEGARPQIVSVSFDRSGIEAIEQEMSLIRSDIGGLEKAELIRQSESKSKINELQIMIRDIQGKELARQAGIRSVQSSNDMAKMRCQLASTNAVKAKEAATKLAAELQKVRASICPTCAQGWSNDAAKAKEAEILAKLQDYKREIVAGIAADKGLLELQEQRKQLDLDIQPRISPEIEPIITQIEQLKLQTQPQAIPEIIEFKLKVDFKSKELLTLRQQEKDHQFKENANQQLIVGLYASKQTELRQAHQVVIKKLQEDESNALYEYESAKNKLKSFEENKARFDKTLATLNDQLLGYSELLVAKEAELVIIQEELELAAESKKAIKSYLSCSFEDALDSIGEAATKLIRGIPNMATCTVQFEGLKENKDGKVKEEVTCLISIDGEQAVPVKSLSGGERSAIDLGIDLAVIAFIEERTGKGIDLFILDEPFTGLDSQCCEDAIEMLKNCTTGKRIFLVDHNPVIAQTIENRLTVVRDGLTSKIMETS